MTKNNKHAFLILAHTDFNLLERLVSCLDDVRNDIFIHFDKKVNHLPNIVTHYSRVHVLKDRIDVRWGDLSVVEAEYKLFEESRHHGAYGYYHLLSGADLPLVSNDKLHDFFRSNFGKQFIGFSTYDYVKEVERKVNYVHLFPSTFRSKRFFLDGLKAILRAFYLRFQLFFKWKRNKSILFKKGTQWVSVTDNFVQELIIRKQDVLKIYDATFCPDEIYKQTICWNSLFREQIYNFTDESMGSMRMIGWDNGRLRDWQFADLEKLQSCERIFARKFNSKDVELIDALLKNLSL